MEIHFRNGKFTEGLCEGVKSASEQLQKHFPKKSFDKNELTNEVSFGKQ